MAYQDGASLADTEIEGSSLSAAIDSELRQAKRYADSELADKRARAMEYLNGTMTDVPSRPNGSTVVSRDLSDTVSWMLPGVIRVFTASDNMALYEPEKPGDEDFARQATDYVNYVFFKDNPGYRILYNATHDSLVLGNAIVRHYWDDTPITTVTKHSGMTAEQIAAIMEDEGIEILAQSPGAVQTLIDIDPQTGQPVPIEVQTFDIKVSRTTMNGKACVESCKPENFFLDSEATTVEDARFVAYLHDDRTRSDLIEMGFDPEVVDGLPADSMLMSTEEELAREESRVAVRTDTFHSQDLIDLYECYIRADVDGDGIAETLQVWYAGAAGAGEVLSAEVWEDDVPFSDIPCYPRPHSFDADGVGDRTMDIQRIKTVLLRQAIDNQYAANLPMMSVEEGSVKNPDILVNPKFGGIIWKKTGSAPITPHAVPYVADKAFGALDYMDQIIAKRTGVSRTTMALDPEALQNQTATASQNQRDAGYSQIELVARNMAELGWVRVFRQLLKIIVKHQDRSRIIRLRDTFVEMDPRVWNAGMDVTINVGLGTGSRDRDMMMLRSVLETQIAMADRFQGAGAVNEAIEMLPKILNTMVKIAESAGLKNPEAYYPEYTEEKVAQLQQMAAEQAAQPDPETERKMAEAQADQQIKQQELAAKERMETAKVQADFNLRIQQMEREFALREYQMEREFQMKEALAIREQDMKRDLGIYTATTQAASTSPVRMGGDPG